MRYLPARLLVRYFLRRNKRRIILFMAGLVVLLGVIAGTAACTSNSPTIATCHDLGPGWVSFNVNSNIVSEQVTDAIQCSDNQGNLSTVITNLHGVIIEIRGNSAFTRNKQGTTP
jgi:hypothetical protein